jgi:tetratricopeptide (TPR) repeat protein
VFTIMIGLLVGVATGSLASLWLGPVWSSLIGLLGTLAATILINLWVRKRLEALFKDVQATVEATQGQLRRKINVMQTKMMSGGKGLQRQMEKEQADGIHEALKKLDGIKPLQRWNLLAVRQANTLRAQLYYQIKEFEKADRCFEKCLIMDPLTLAMKMSRQYAHGQTKALEKAFRKGIKRYKDEEAIILYALYSWTLVEANRIDDAVALLNDAKEKTENAVLRTNWEHLANGRVRHFSNAGLGDQWYALHLETPKPVKVKHRFGSGKRW